MPGAVVLLVEDELELLDVMAAGFRKAGYHVLVASNGTAAIRLLETGHVDLVVVDMILPGTSGFQVVEQVRHQYALRVGITDTPIIMISGHLSAPHRAYASALGVNSFLEKPFSLTTLIKEAFRWRHPQVKTTEGSGPLLS